MVPSKQNLLLVLVALEVEVPKKSEKVAQHDPTAHAVVSLFSFEFSSDPTCLITGQGAHEASVALDPVAQLRGHRRAAGAVAAGGETALGWRNDPGGQPDGGRCQ